MAGVEVRGTSTEPPGRSILGARCARPQPLLSARFRFYFVADRYVPQNRSTIPTNQPRQTFGLATRALPCSTNNREKEEKNCSRFERIEYWPSSGTRHDYLGVSKGFTRKHHIVANDFLRHGRPGESTVPRWPGREARRDVGRLIIRSFVCATTVPAIPKQQKRESIHKRCLCVYPA